MIVTSGFMALGTLLRSDISTCTKIFLHQKYLYLMHVLATLSVCRCVTLYIHDPSHSLFTISCHVCSILNGMSNIVVGSVHCIVHTILYCTHCTVDSIGRGSSHNIEVGPWFSKSVPCTQHSWTKKSSIKVQEDA